ncbi:Malate/lactate/ureidoglycolate dehydrogenase, LDH2 family [Cohaesibacter sp. ES.047]|uniref:Ldh family oxidoreductase n=1 Tax=Cohaesibacter sp. ES.047 TaxID=1798205 RepID=UPI000BB8F596|nr:Ldh family oxidoreductase [Cohaesibacter sp. ES.047]SNY93609.1 Malate/lactate/ureidoglycolate dehydrogenase, LDH2 family [Cohaesibacter sp. ES.047]
MTKTVQLALDDIKPFCVKILRHHGYGNAHADAIADMLYTCQLDDCQSHGLFRLFMAIDTISNGKIDGNAEPVIASSSNAIVKADASNGMSQLAFEQASPELIAKARQHGIAALAINNCYHFSALWPVVEQLASLGLAAMSMVPSQSWVAPAGGTRGSLGTNPFAFSWPRQGKNPFTFDFATSAFARGEIELYRREGKPLPEGVAVDKDGKPTTDPQAAMDGAMLTFGGYKGSALSIMIELLAGPLIDDLTSLESMDHAEGRGGAPYHGQVIIAFDLAQFNGSHTDQNDARAERLFADIVDQGARLPSQRRYAARARNLERGFVEISKQLHDDILKLQE